MSDNDYDDDDFDWGCPDCGCSPCCCDFEEIERQRWEKQKAYWADLPAQKLAEEWWRECRRHDSAVDRCEALNSPTIEDAQANMNWIEAEFKRRGLSHHDYVHDEPNPTERRQG